MDERVRKAGPAEPEAGAREARHGRNAPPPNLDECLIRVRLHKKDGVYVAHCLELDLVATDDEPWRALEKVSLLMNRQIEFGIRHHYEAHIWFPAPPEYDPPEARAHREREERLRRKWISVEERRPQVEELPCLVWRGTTHRIEVGRPMPPFGKGTQDMWMPLPEPPIAAIRTEVEG